MNIDKEMFAWDDHSNEILHDMTYTSEEIINYILECQDKAHNWDEMQKSFDKYRDIQND